MTTKLMNNKKRNHATKVLDQMSKNLAPEAPISPKTVGLSIDNNEKVELKDQYNVIREDLMKLQTDVTKGLDLAKSYINKLQPKTLVMDYLKTKNLFS
jgi:hypothetical protein